MTLDYTKKGSVEISMQIYVSEILDSAANNMGGNAILPAANHLFFVNTIDPILLVEKAQLFHQILAKMLFLSKRSLPDLSTAVAFATTWVMLEDWRKNLVWRKDPKDTKNAKDTKVPELRRNARVSGDSDDLKHKTGNKTEQIMGK